MDKLDKSDNEYAKDDGTETTRGAIGDVVKAHPRSNLQYPFAAWENGRPS